MAEMQVQLDDLSAAQRVLTDAALFLHITEFQRGLPYFAYAFALAHGYDRTMLQCRDRDQDLHDGVASYAARRRLQDAQVPRLYTYPHHPPLPVVRVLSLPQLAIAAHDNAMLARLFALRQRSNYYRDLRVLSFDHAMPDAAGCGDALVVEWLHRQHGGYCDAGTVSAAATEGRMKVLLWVFQHCSSCSSGIDAATVNLAVANGHLDVIKFLYAKVPQVFSSDAAMHAVVHGHLSILKFLEDSGLLVEFDLSEALVNAARYGHLDVLEYLHSRVETSSTMAMDLAATYGHLDVLQFLHQNRCEGCTTKAMDNAATNGHLEVVQFLRKNREEGCTTRAMDGAASRGYFDVVMFLHENTTSGFTQQAVIDAAEHGHFEIVKWLHAEMTKLQWPEAQCKTAIGTAMKGAARAGHLEIVQFLCRFGCTAVDLDEARLFAGNAEVTQYLQGLMHWYERKTPSSARASAPQSTAPMASWSLRGCVHAVKNNS